MRLGRCGHIQPSSKQAERTRELCSEADEVAEPLQLLRAPQREDRCHPSWTLPGAPLERVFACEKPSSPLGVLAERALLSCESPLRRLEALTTMLVSSHLSKLSYTTARDELWRNVSAGALECKSVVGAVLQALAHAAALEPRDFERENATLGATRVLGLLTVKSSGFSRFGGHNTVLHEAVLAEVDPLREESELEARMAPLTELMDTPRTAEFTSQSDAWLDARSQLEALHRRPFGSYPNGPFALLAIAFALHDIGRTALAAGRGASTPDEALPALAARLLKLVSVALRRRGLLLHRLAHAEQRAAEWQRTQARIDEAMRRNPSLLAADLGTLAQANLENPEHYHKNARYHTASNQPPPPPPAPTLLYTPGLSASPASRRTPFRCWQSQIICQLITRAASPETMDPFVRECWTYVRPEVKASLEASCLQLRDARLQVPSRRAPTPTRILADHVPSFAALTLYHPACAPDARRCPQCGQRGPIAGRRRAATGTDLRLRARAQPQRRVRGRPTGARRGSSTPNPPASLEPPRHRRHPLLLAR